MPSRPIQDPREPLVRGRQPTPVDTIERLEPVWIDQGGRVVAGVLIGWQRWSRGWYGHTATVFEGDVYFGWVQASRLRTITVEEAPPAAGFGG